MFWLWASWPQLRPSGSLRESSVIFCFLSLSVQIFPNSSFFYPEDGAVIFFNTVTVCGTAWRHTPENTFHQLTVHNATWVYSWWYMCPIFVSLITAPLLHGERASVRTFHYNCCAETPWKGHCALLSLNKHARKCLCICGRSVSKHGWEETVKIPWCTDHFLCSRNFACIVMGYFPVHRSFLISHSVVLTLCTPEGPVAAMRQRCKWLQRLHFRMLSVMDSRNISYISLNGCTRSEVRQSPSILWAQISIFSWLLMIG